MTTATTRCWAPVEWCATRTRTRVPARASPAPALLCRPRPRLWPTTATCLHPPRSSRGHRGSRAGQANPDLRGHQGSQGPRVRWGPRGTRGTGAEAGFWVWAMMELSARLHTTRTHGLLSTRDWRTHTRAMRSSSSTTWSPTSATTMMALRASSYAVYRARISSSTMSWWEEVTEPACGLTCARTDRWVPNRSSLHKSYLWKCFFYVESLLHYTMYYVCLKAYIL